MNNFITNLRIFSVLIHKELRFLFSNFKNNLLDCISPLCVQVLTIGYLFPLMGMPKEMIAPIYLGAMIPLLMQLGFSYIMHNVFDLEFGRFIDYHLTLPLPKRWLFGVFIINHMVEVACITIPLYVIGIFILHNFFIISQLNWFAFICMYCLILFFFASFNVAASYTFSFNWILDNFWPRILIPLWWFSSAVMIWKKIYIWNHILGLIMLLSPFTYIAEGMRSALLGGNDYIAWPVCACMLILFSVLNIIVLNYGIQKKLDPV